MAGITAGTVTVTGIGTRVRVVVPNTAILSVTFTAQPANTGSIFIGDSTVAEDVGITLLKQDHISITFPENNAGDLSDFYVDTSVGGEKADYIAVLA